MLFSCFFPEQTLMAAKSCDDPVDLGPFLQNYVMKNPFSESSLLVTSSSSLPSSVPVVSSPSETSSSGTQSMYGVQDAITIDKRPRTVAEMLRKARGSETISGDKSKRVGNVRPSVTSSNSATTTTLRPIRPRIVVENKEPASVAVTTPIVVQAVGMAPVGMTPVTVQAAPVVMHQTIAAAAAKHAAKISRPKPAKSTASIVIPSSVGIANAKKSVVMLANPDEMMGKYGNSADCDRTQIESW